ncbi:hypothetical protein N7470_002707 [Penicillium chermesinum]|nr:hypothetical protein N7470_002707 [Penicillium chermesinum]
MSELVEIAPSYITAFAAYRSPRQGDEDEKGLRYRFWGVKAHNWSLTKENWTPMRILLPPKKVPCGLLNDLLTSGRLGSILWCETRAINWLKLETYARYSDSSGIECLDPGGGSLIFQTLGAFKQHIQEKCRRSPWFIRDRELVLCHRNTPAEVKAVMNTKQHCVDKMVSIRDTINAGLRDQFRRPGEAKIQFKETLTTQMKEHGYHAPDESLGCAYLWYSLDDEFFEFDYPAYPVEISIDPECPEEEFLGCDYTGEEYFEYPD